ncbi:MAG: DUF4372 domain-containing protein [Ignavibacteriales bacterium]|nr:DUF4372 domain-containing protein [Ignavibacteriales bacterium]
MLKDTEIKLVGQTILGQMLNLVDKIKFSALVQKKDNDRYYQAFKSWVRFLLCCSEY